MSKIIFFIFGCLVWAVNAQALDFDLPMDCEIGRDCWVQQYVDHDAGEGIADYSCGSASYNGHDGTDFRVRDTTSKADVLAAADGMVVGLRDGVRDHLVRNDEDRKAVAKIECGNGVLLRHADGFETQYCHMKQNSVAVKKGDLVRRGDRLGQVGYSGEAAFPHVHFKLSKAGAVLDPFEGDMASACNVNGASLWSADAKAEAVYAARDVLHLGWHDQAIKLEDLEDGRTASAKPNAQWPALVAAVWMINLKAGDQVTLQILGPDGFSVENQEVLERSKAQYFLFAGKKLKTSAWPKGEYRAAVTIRNGGEAVLEKTVVVAID